MDKKAAILNRFQGDFQSFYGKYLPNAKQIGGDQYQALCIFHEDDKTPSFSFNNKDGRFYCHGCGKKGDLFHFYGKINDLSTKRDFGKILTGIGNDFGITMEEVKRRIVKVYDYHDSEGKLIHQTVRYEPKHFSQRRPNGNGRWIWNLKDIQPVLYRLSDVMKADEVLVVEGEKDADNLSSLGFTATTCAMGAKAWRDDYSDCLKDKSIVLIPDNDEEGRRHMVKVAASINGNSKGLKWIDLPGVPNKGDASDFIASFQDKEEATERLAIIIENAPPYEPPKKKTIEDVICESNQFRILDVTPKRTILNPWLSEQSISLMSGWRGSGKTWSALSLLDSITRGKAFGPWGCEMSVPCLFLDGEMPVQDIQERLNELGSDSDRKNPLYIYSDAYANLFGLPRAHLANESWRSSMKRILITRKIKLWVIDNLASLAGGLDENSKKDWDPINQWLLELRFAGISTIMLHHTNKDDGQRGTSGREDNLDISIILKRPSDYVPEDGCRFICHFTKARVKTSDLQLIADTEFKLIQNETGQSVWTWKNVKQETSRQVLKMIDEGFEQKAIGETLNISPGRVSQIKKQAIADGYISKKGNLTQSGITHVSE